MGSTKLHRILEHLRFGNQALLEEQLLELSRETLQQEKRDMRCNCAANACTLYHQRDKDDKTRDRRGRNFYDAFVENEEKLMRPHFQQKSCKSNEMRSELLDAVQKLLWTHPAMGEFFCCCNQIKQKAFYILCKIVLSLLI